MTEERIKHLEMIQGIISRMSEHSSAVRNWAVTVAAALLIFNASQTDYRATWILLLILGAFGFLDVFYNQTERRYRALFKSVRELKQEIPTDFDLSISGVKPEKQSWFGKFTFWTFWVTLAGAAVLIANLSN